MVIKWRKKGHRGRIRKNKEDVFMSGGNMAHFSSPILYQHGRGLGGVLSGIFKSVIPFFKKSIVRKGLKRIGKSAAMAGLEALNTSMSDAPNRPTFKDALKQSVKGQTRTLSSGALAHLKSPSSSAGNKPIKASNARPKRPRLIPYKLQGGRGVVRRRKTRRNRDVFSL